MEPFPQLPNGHRHSEQNSSLGTQCLNLHALGEQWIEEVTDVDIVQTTPEECLEGEHIKFKAHIRGWKTVTREMRCQSLLAKTEHNLRKALLSTPWKDVLLVPQAWNPVQNNYDWNRIVGTISTFVMTINIFLLLTQQWLLALDAASCAQHVQSTCRMNLTVPRPSTKGSPFLACKYDFALHACVCVFITAGPIIKLCVFITAGPIIKLCAGGEGDSEGHVL